MAGRKQTEIWILIIAVIALAVLLCMKFFRDANIFAEYDLKLADLKKENQKLADDYVELKEREEAVEQGIISLRASDESANRKLYELYSVYAENANGADSQSDPEQTGTELDTVVDQIDDADFAAEGEAVVDIEGMEPGSIINTDIVRDSEDTFFRKFEILEGDPIFNRIYGRSYVDNPDISLSDLRYLKVIHYNFNHEIQVGELIANADVADDFLSIFRELFDAEYEINSMYLIDNFWTGDGDSSDNASIQVNNTSCFCYRLVTGGSTLSNHAYGRAIDINPQQNPYVWYENGQPVCYHENAIPFLDRSLDDPHVIVAGDLCYEVFQKYGFSWGGEWSFPIDYQHFEK